MSEPTRSRRRPRFTIDDARVALVCTGLVILSVGGVVVANDVSPNEYPAIILWLVVALIVHDVLISGVVFAVAFAGRRATTRLPLRAILVVQSVLAVGAIVALLVTPEIVGKALGTPANPSILPLDYALNLAVLWGLLAVVAVGAVALHVALHRRTARRSD